MMLLLLVTVASAASLTGLVVKVYDGDTLTVADRSGEEHRIRLAQIDAPEKKQDFGQQSRDALASMVLDQTVVVDYEKTDRYGRIIGQVHRDHVDVNLALVASGLAWTYTEYKPDPLYVQLELEARQTHAGLWSVSNPLPPWEYRKLKK